MTDQTRVKRGYINSGDPASAIGRALNGAPVYDTYDEAEAKAEKSRTGRIRVYALTIRAEEVQGWGFTPQLESEATP